MTACNPRRQILAAGVLLACASAFNARGQTRAPRVRIGLLLSGFEANYAQAEREFLAGMRELGYVEGENLSLERRYAHLRPDRMSESATDLAGLKLDAIVTGCTGSTRAVQRAAPNTPVVMASVADPVGQGFARGLTYSGTNVTGRSSQSRDLMPKMLELFSLAVPGMETIAILVNTLNTVHETLWSDAVVAASALHLKFVRVDVRGPADLTTALAKFGASRVHGFFVLPDDPMALNHRAGIVDFANRHRLPSFYGYREFVDAGGLMSYGERFAESYRHTARYVDKVVHGANPSLLPIEQPTRFELVINLKTAAALGLNVPKSLLLRADETVR